MHREEVVSLQEQIEALAKDLDRIKKKVRITAALTAIRVVLDLLMILFSLNRLARSPRH